MGALRHTLHLDFETRSTLDLKKVGIRRYVECPHTDVWMCCWALDDGPVHTWLRGDPLPQALRQALESPDVRVAGHNVAFEWHIIEWIMGCRYGWPLVDPERLEDTAARAAIQALPRDLDGAARALLLPVRKDTEGHRLMLRMARPRRIGPDGQPVWWEDPDKIRRLAEYCARDVEVERELDRVLFPMPPVERRIWALDFTMNYLRGVQVDLDLVRKARAVLKAATVVYGERLHRLTGGRVSSVTQLNQIRGWLAHRGVHTDSLDKASVDALLSGAGTENPLPLPEDVCQVLQIRQEAGKSSTAKLTALLDRTAADGRLYELLLYHGASTGRWSGRGAQLHNLPRPNLKKKWVQWAIDLIKRGDMTPGDKVDAIEFMLGPVPQVVSDCLRGVIVASDGHTLHVSDYSNIEGRGNAWLSGQADKVETFRQNGPVYEKMGAAIFRIPLEEVTKESLARFVGKQAELGCGYQMSWLKFQATCAGYGQDLSDEVCQTAVGTFRRVNDKIVLNWKVLEEAALDAVRQPGVSFSVQGGRVKFLCRREMDFLVCTLPSRRRIYYPWPQIEQAETPWGAMRDQLSYMTVHPQTRQWVRTTTYGGKLDENIVQAISRDVLASAMLRLDRARFWLVLTVHDEIVSDDPPADGLSQENFERVMAHVPDWAEGLPIAVEGFEAPRYRK